MRDDSSTQVEKGGAITMTKRKIFCVLLSVLYLSVLSSVQPGVAQDSQTPFLFPDIGGADPIRIVRELFSRFRSGELAPLRNGFAPEVWDQIMGDLDELQSVALAMPDPQHISVFRLNRDENESVYEVEIEHMFPSVPENTPVAALNERSYWLIGYNATRQLIDTFSFRPKLPIETIDPAPYFPPDLMQPNVSNALKVLSQPPFEKQNFIMLRFATTRQPDGKSFGSDRSGLTFGAVRVHVPDDHRMGKLELPRMQGWFPFSYEEKLDLVKHFAIGWLGTIKDSDWYSGITNSNLHEALVFVHGFNNTFDDSVYRTAQIMWDLQYKGIPILFPWPSQGGATDPASIAVAYAHDQDSSLTESDAFDELLHNLHSRGITKIHLLVHSMGNFLVLNALRRESALKEPIKIGEWILAAPDIDVEMFSQFFPTVQPYVGHTTIYASAMDNALLASMAARGGKPRVGFVPNGEPILMAGIDSIDVSALGGELFGLNHDVFASNRSLIDDIGLILDGRLPDQRLRELRPVPGNPPPPRYWRFAP
jgi:esterase/lipase superfamily enzyme